MARQIGQMLGTCEPKIVNGPEVLNKYVGESKKNIRALFEDAEKDQAENGDNASLHLIVFDEIDAICKKRGSTRDSTGVSDSIVNQLLSKIDGYDALNDVLLIGMTNRRDLIDDALLRPGRLEVQIGVNFPNEPGRQQIFKIHTRSLAKNKRLGSDVSIEELAVKTPNYTGAEIAGVVKSAVSFALNERIGVKNVKQNIDVSNLVVHKEHFDLALNEVKPAFGIDDDTLTAFYPRGICDFSKSFTKQKRQMGEYISTLNDREFSTLMSFLIIGPSGAGLTALATYLASHGGFPFARIITARMFIGRNEDSSCAEILTIF